jgi:thioredoxin 1
MKMEQADQELEALRLKKAGKLMNQVLLPASIVKLHTAEEYKNLTEKYPETIIVIDFTAVWCGPCKIYAPIFERLQSEYYKDFIFAKVDVDENRTTAMQYQISGVPTTLFVKKGNEINRGVGALNYDMLKQYLEELKTSKS